MSEYAIHQPTREELSKLAGATLLEFGTDWCGYCNRARPLITQVLSQFPHVKHLKIEDGLGRKLGRLFKVKLWPTLILLQDGMGIGQASLNR